MAATDKYTPKQDRPKLSEVCIYGGKQSDEFVGIRYDNGSLKVYFPYGYSRPADDEKEYRKDILNLISVLAAYSKESKSVDHNRQLNEDEVQFPIHAYIHVFNYFLNFGYYIENETTYKRASSGRINWPKTIKQIRPQIAGERPNESVVYLDFITKRSSNNENEIIMQSAEENGLSSMEDKRLGGWFITPKKEANAAEGEASKITNEAFAEKVLKYLWDDAFKFDRSKHFGEIKTLEDLTKEFKKEGFKVFKDESISNLMP